MGTQARWRAAGAAALVGAALMAWGGVHWDVVRHGTVVVGAYGGGIVFLLALAMYVAVLDVRYIQAEYAIARRELFRQTLGDEEFRKALRASPGGKPQSEVGAGSGPLSTTDSRRNLN